MLESILSSFVLVAGSEMGDKTQLLAFSLALRFKRPWTVMGGIFTATILNHALAAWAGQFAAQLLHSATLRYVLSVSFFAFGFWTLVPDSLKEDKKQLPWNCFLTTTVLFFLAEMGDKTQLATVALGAQFQSILAVTIGTTAGMMAADGLAVFLGEKFAEKVQMNKVRFFAAMLFFMFGIVALFQAMRASGVF